MQNSRTGEGSTFGEVLVVDPDREAHSAVRLCFADSDRAPVTVHAARTNDDARRFLEHRAVDLVVVEGRGPGVGALELIEWLRPRNPRVPIVVTGNGVTREDLIDVVNAGANYYLEKPVTADRLRAALARIAARAVPPEANVPRRSRLATGGPGDPMRALPLSERERDIALKVSEGLSNREIAQAMQISEQTVRNHLSKIYRKLLINSRSQLARVVLLLE
jgi:DNA-binding NarL/FixJ family response regulator